ncbi:MAG: YcgN family cysteine cluster protein [Alphaproteobacteria bacterium]|nr:MAG: YcgN family cysteine cluster protein [Alphaproteobacteria bacterium]
MSEPFWEKPLANLSREEWESLCDGCGKCCLHKLEDDLSGEVHPTNVACKLLDLNSGRCSNYRGRRALVPDCLRLSPVNVERFAWLPTTCAYRLRSEGKPLPEWHYLISGDPESVHRAGISVRGWTISEVDAGDLQNHLVDREL